MSLASERSLAAHHTVVACTLRGRRRSDAIEIVTERDGAVGIIVLDVRAARDQEPLRKRLAERAREALQAHEALHSIASSLRKIVCEAVAASVGVIALRVSSSDARVELLNAGMPPVACVLPDGRLLQLPALSSDIGPRAQRAHPYELIPLTPGSTWLLASDGATAGSLDDSGELWSALGLPHAAASLAEESNENLAARLGAALAGPALPEDASLVVIPTTPNERPESGIM